MLDDELTLLDGTSVVTLGAAAALAGKDFWDVYDTIEERLSPETVLDGVRYYRRDTVMSLIAGSR